MYEKLLKLKEEKQWLFWLLIIPFVLAAGYEFYNRYLINSGKQAVKDAEKKDEKLKDKQIKAEVAAEVHEKKADEIEQKIKDTKVDKDWYLK